MTRREPLYSGRGRVVERHKGLIRRQAHHALGNSVHLLVFLHKPVEQLEQVADDLALTKLRRHVNCGPALLVAGVDVQLVVVRLRDI